MEPWGRDRAPDLVELTDAALPAEGLSEDELLSCLWEDPDPAVVVGDAAGDAVAAAVVRSVGGRPEAFVRLVVVRPGARREGRGRRLLAAVHEWAFDEHGCRAVGAGGGPPFYLWPGVDRRAVAARGLFESVGYGRRGPAGAEEVLTFPTTGRRPGGALRAGVVVRRPLEEDEAEAVTAFVRRHWPAREAELARALEQGTCLVAGPPGGPEAAGEPAGLAGFACHSVNRLGWLGPVGVDPAAGAAGVPAVAAALAAAVATDLRAAGVGDVRVERPRVPGAVVAAAGAVPWRSFDGLRLVRARRTGAPPAGTA